MRARCTPVSSPSLDLIHHSPRLGESAASVELFAQLEVLVGQLGVVVRIAFCLGETTEFLLSKVDDFGTPHAYNHYAVGWAHALCTPYQWTKQIASHWGGTRTGTIVHWPNGITDKGTMRNQFHHVIDVAPTILEAARLPAPVSVNGIQQAPLEGVSMLPTLRDGDTPETHDLQYFEIMGNRGIYHQGWTAVTKHRTPWLVDAPPFDQDIWELYGPDDWTQAHNLAEANPEKLAERQRLWLIEAVKYNVVPLDDRSFERINPDLAGRPQLIRGNSQLLFPGMRVSENCVLNIKNKSHAVTANVVVPESGANGVIITQGGSVGGWTLYAHARRLKYCYNFFGIEHYIIAADDPIPRPVSIKSGWNSATTAAVWPRAATSPCITTERRSGRDGWIAASRWPSLPTRPATWAPTPAHRRLSTTARRAKSSPVISRGCKSTSATTATTTSSPRRTGCTSP